MILRRSLEWFHETWLRYQDSDSRLGHRGQYRTAHPSNYVRPFCSSKDRKKYSSAGISGTSMSRLKTIRLIRTIRAKWYEGNQ